MNLAYTKFNVYLHDLLKSIIPFGGAKKKPLQF